LLAAAADRGRAGNAGEDVLKLELLMMVVLTTTPPESTTCLPPPPILVPVAVPFDKIC
jgi:hypothetical protein